MANRDLPVARAALARYGITGRLRCLATGLDTTFRVRADDGRQFALKVGGINPDRPPAMLAEASWIIALGRDTHLWVPQVVEADGSPIVVVEHEGHLRPAMLTTWLAGRERRWRPSREVVFEVGRVAAFLHAHGRRFVPPEGSSLDTWKAASATARWGPDDQLATVAGPGAEAVADALRRQLEIAEATIAPSGFGLIHGDLGLHNVMTDGARIGYFDFNDVKWGWYAYDLARLARTLRWRVGGEVLVANVLDGYTAVAELPEGFEEHHVIFEAAANLHLARYLSGLVAERGPETPDTVRRLIADITAVL